MRLYRCKNTYENAVIYENGEIQTTKILDTDEHGIGIKNIAETIRKYGGSYVIQNDERELLFFHYDSSSEK